MGQKTRKTDRKRAPQRECQRDRQGGYAKANCADEQQTEKTHSQDGNDRCETLNLIFISFRINGTKLQFKKLQK